MKIYIASSFAFVKEVENLSKLLEHQGHSITEKWFNRPYQIPSMGTVHTTDLKKIYEALSNQEFYNKPETKTSFELDKKGVEECDAFVLYAGNKPRKFNGANIELGIAIANNKLCFALGELEKSVLYYPVRQFSNAFELIYYLEEVK